MRRALAERVAAKFRAEARRSRKCCAGSRRRLTYVWMARRLLQALLLGGVPFSFVVCRRSSAANQTAAGRNAHRRRRRRRRRKWIARICRCAVRKIQSRPNWMRWHISVHTLRARALPVSQRRRKHTDVIIDSPANRIATFTSVVTTRYPLCTARAFCETRQKAQKKNPAPQRVEHLPANWSCDLTTVTIIDAAVDVFKPRELVRFFPTVRGQTTANWNGKPPACRNDAIDAIRSLAIDRSIINVTPAAAYLSASNEWPMIVSAATMPPTPVRRWHTSKLGKRTASDDECNASCALTS